VQLLSGRDAGLQNGREGVATPAQPSSPRTSILEVGLESDGDSRSVSKHGNEQLNEGKKKEMT